MKKKIEIFCTLGPSSLNKNFLKFVNKKISLLRLNMSHIEPSKLSKTISFVRKYSKVPICIDTEGAQIRSKVKKKKFYRKNQYLYIYKRYGFFKIYPNDVFSQLRQNDFLSVGFNDLELKIIKKNKETLKCKVMNSGLLESNKGIHLTNRSIKLNFITEKDQEAIKIAKSMGVKHFALSFTNTPDDIKNFNKLLKNKKKIFKIETKQALNNLTKIIRSGQNFLIDRGDLSKDISIEMLPVIQRKILKTANAMKNKNIYVATNFLESMINNQSPTRGEANDIYNTLELGAGGLVLAAETAIGKYPKECIKFLRKIIKVYNENK